MFPDQDPEMSDDQDTATRMVAENTPKAGQAIGDPVVAEDEDGDILTYTLTGNVADSFAIDRATGQIMRTKADAGPRRWVTATPSRSGPRTRPAYPKRPILCSRTATRSW